ncbi:RHS repeat-associated core domain-containing protein [Paenirhodobacter sp.]|uniref:RHS repeat-associated core domain-containing protein n=1 Tax=Paenirhodobacter sp. TaxID=1965326 RepID=UPI003B3ED4C2
MGTKAESAVYRPFGEQTNWRSPAITEPESRGWIGERYDADSGLQYLNARYYDPELSLFLQPDWLDIMRPSVGTNRYAYSFNDPVNLRDPKGNWFVADDVFAGPVDEFVAIAGRTIAAYMGSELEQEKLRSIMSIIGIESRNINETKVINPEINEGAQGKHRPGHNDFDPHRSPIDSEVNPHDLFGGAIRGEFDKVGETPRGDPIGKRGSHVVPAGEDAVRNAKDREHQKRQDDNGAESDNEVDEKWKYQIK